jgi:hypothetical protein
MRNETLLPIAQFLARVWSDVNANVVITNKIDVPQTKLNTKTVYLLPISKLPFTDLLAAYRVWRFSIFHEAMHLKHSKIVNFDNVELEIKYILQKLLNIVEDYRIEELGKLEYGGMIVEQEFVRAIIYGVSRPPENIYDEFGQLLLLGMVKGKEPDEKVIKAVEYVKSCFKKSLHQDSYAIAKDVLDILGIDYNVAHGIEMETIIHIIFNKKKFKMVTKKKLKDAIKIYVEDKAKRNMKGGDEEENKEEQAVELLTPNKTIKEELEKIVENDKQLENTREEELKKIDNLKLPSMLDVNEDRYYDTQLISHLKAQLRKLKKGYVEIPSTHGEFDIDSYIARSSKVFIDEEKLKLKKLKVLLLLDYSNSISFVGKEFEYKSACITLAEALNELNVNFAVYGFTSYSYGNEIYLIKSFEEKWTKMNAKRLVQYPANGNTPLGYTYYSLFPLVKRYSDRNNFLFITLTDGDPTDSMYLYLQMIQKLKNHCRMIAIGFGMNIEHAVLLTKKLQNRGYDSAVALDDLKKLPEKILSLLD